MYIAARDKDNVISLLDHYHLSYEIFSESSAGLLGLASELLIRDWKVLRFHQKYNFLI